MSGNAEQEGAKPAMVTVAGIAASRGFAAGPVFVHRPDDIISVPEYEIPPERVMSELDRYHAARAETRAQIEALIAQFKDGDGRGTDVFVNHLAILDDAAMTASVERLVRETRLNAEAALRRTVAEFRAAFGRMHDPYLRERVRDVDDVERRLLRVLLGRDENLFSQITEPVVVVAADLAPSETVALRRELVLGFALDRGSATSHVALLARALGIPAVVGLGDVSARVKPGDDILVDGTNGAVTVNPDVKTCAEFARLVRRERELYALLNEDKAKAGATRDGAPVRFCANAQPGVPMGGLAAFGAQGVGLYRSEYLWLAGDGDPSEDRQTEVYSDAVRAAAAMGESARVVFRALDIGGDKAMRRQGVREPNPFLGNRSIRWLLSHRSVFRAQLRAILKASAVGPSAVLWPMVATMQELQEANAELERAKDELRAEGVAFDEQMPKGCMIEIPSAALCADQLARAVDFFSIGTNDLVQYTMAADRGNESVAHLYQPTNPAVLKLIRMTIEAAKNAGITVGVCGESAADPIVGVLWAAMGVDHLSMSPTYIPLISKILARLTREDLDEYARVPENVPPGETAHEIYDICHSWLYTKIPNLDDILI